MEVLFEKDMMFTMRT